jgi:hypothetical protein
MNPPIPLALQTHSDLLADTCETVQGFHIIPDRAITKPSLALLDDGSERWLTTGLEVRDEFLAQDGEWTSERAGMPISRECRLQFRSETIPIWDFSSASMPVWLIPARRRTANSPM